MENIHRIIIRLGDFQSKPQYKPYEYGENQGKGGRIEIDFASLSIEFHGTEEEIYAFRLGIAKAL